MSGDIFRKEKANTATISNMDRYDPKGCETTMKAVVTNGNGGYEQLEYLDGLRFAMVHSRNS